MSARRISTILADVTSEEQIVSSSPALVEEEVVACSCCFVVSVFVDRGSVIRLYTSGKVFFNLRDLT